MGGGVGGGAWMRDDAEPALSEIVVASCSTLRARRFKSNLGHPEVMIGLGPAWMGMSVLGLR